MTEAKDIDNINNIMDMIRTMQALGVSCEGLQTLDEMKNRVKEMLKTSQEKSSWTAKEVRFSRAKTCGFNFPKSIACYKTTTASVKLENIP